MRSLIGTGLGNTVLLMTTSLPFALAIGIAVGHTSGRWQDRTLSVLELLLYSALGFWLALMAIVLSLCEGRRVALEQVTPHFTAARPARAGRCFHGSNGPTQAVRGLELTFQRGEMRALVGESGCVKSTTALERAAFLVRLARHHQGGEQPERGLSAGRPTC